MFVCHLNGKTLLERVALNAAPQVGALVLNINTPADLSMAETQQM